jgi:NADH pyrophosphatase NudC (nudix superfamily)
VWFRILRFGCKIEEVEAKEAEVIDKDDPRWQKLTEEILSGMAEWRQQHPKATLREIEREVMRRTGELQAKLMEEIAQASAAADWEEGAAPRCPECGAEMERRGEHGRSLQAAGGGEVSLKRAYAVCPRCGAEFFPPG